MKRIFYLASILAILACSPVTAPTEDSDDITEQPADTTVVNESHSNGSSEEGVSDETSSGNATDDLESETEIQPENGLDSEPEVDVNAYNDYARVTLKSEVKNVLPMTGIVLWSESSNASSQKEYIQLEFAYMLYNQVCKEKDVYDWSPMDKLLAQVAARGHQLVVRFRYSYVGKQCAVPDYIKRWPGYEETSGKSEGKTTYFPDWRCEELQRFHLDFHKRFAERYDNDPRLAFVQTGFGLWAEYHIYDGPMVLGKTFPSKNFQATFFKEMDKYFENTTWSISIDAADSYYSPLEAQPDLLKLRFGNFDDSFMHKTHNEYNRDCWIFFGLNRYKKAPCGGEFSYYSDYDQAHCLDKAGMYGRVFEDEVAKYHMTYIIGNDQPGYQSMSRIKEASMSMGYKYEILDYRIKDNKAAVLIKNIGVAPIYRDAYVAIGSHTGSYSLAGLMPGKTAWVLIEGEGVNAAEKPRIVCDHLVSGQKIEYKADVK